MANDLINGEGAGKPAPSAQDTSVWMYRGREGKLFASKADVPDGEGWKDAPHDIEEAAAVEPEKPRGKKLKVAKDDDGNGD